MSRSRKYLQKLYTVTGLATTIKYTKSKLDTGMSSHSTSNACTMGNEQSTTVTPTISRQSSKNENLEGFTKSQRGVTSFKAEDISAKILELQKADKIKSEYYDLWYLDDRYMATQSWSIGETHMDRNRYCNRIPYDKNRVILNIEDYFSSGPEISKLEKLPANQLSFYKYINASPIKNLSTCKNVRNYIASQGPINVEAYASENYIATDTVVDFWMMVVDQKIAFMASITNHCAKYWPELGRVLDPKKLSRFGKVLFKIENVKEEDKVIYTERTLSVTDLSKAESVSWEVTQLHYKTWPDYGVPKDVNAVLDFLQVINDKYSEKIGYIQENELSDTFLVHCTAGIGRTGTIIALDTIFNEIRENGFSVEIDIYKLVNKMRQQRMTMLEAYEQYKFCYFAVEAYYERNIN